MNPHAGRPLSFLLIVLLSACSEPAVEQIAVTVPENVTVPPDMAYIPAGNFIMGSPKDGRTPGGKTVRLPAYLIDRHETTRRQYHAFKADYTYSPKKANYPASHVTYHDADAYCRFRGKRLPTEAEWEKAARGTDGRKWPWRIFFQHPNNGFSGFIPEPVDKRDGWVSPYGVYGMGYNVWEWVADWYDYDGMPAERRKKFKVIRGGLTQTHLSVGASPTWFRNYMEPDKRFNFIGLRCAMDAGKTELK